MDKTLKIINQMLNQNLFEKYAIGGGIAAIFYIEPITTFDLDIFIIIKQEQTITTLTPIYNWLGNKGYKFKNEQIIIQGIPVQFIPAYNELIKEAVDQAIQKKYKGVNTYVVRAEYLFAIMLQTYRHKDKERMLRFMEQVKLSDELLLSILEKYNLKKSYLAFKEKYFE